MVTLVQLLQDPSGFRYAEGQRWAVGTQWQAVFVALVYAVCNFVGQRLMRRRPAFDLRTPLVLWNAALAVFSIAGSYVLLPEMVATVRRVGVIGSWCRLESYFDGESGFWAFLFLISKVAEMGDTLFLVLRKRPVIFLHWYHHATVAAWMWVSYPSGSAAVRWGIGMNYVVHAIMYSYYTARAAGLKLPKALAQSVTSLQMLQFVVAIGITIDVLVKIELGDENCPDNPRFVIMGQSVLYVTYLLLFARFFAKAYTKRQRSASKSE